MEECSSSRRYAVAAAGRPASATPIRHRSTSNAVHDGASAHPIAQSVESSIERWMRRVRPTTSESGPTTSIASPSDSVVSETVSVASVVDTSKRVASAGRIAWVL